MYVYYTKYPNTPSGSNYQISENCNLRFILNRMLEQNYRYLKVSLVRWKKRSARFSGTLPTAITGTDRSRIYLWTCMLYSVRFFHGMISKQPPCFHLLVSSDRAKKRRIFLSLRIIRWHFNFNIAAELRLTHGDPRNIASKRNLIDLWIAYRALNLWFMLRLSNI